MISKAMYLGKAPYDWKERTGAQGNMIPARKGTAYYFITGDWDEDSDILLDRGKTRVMNVDEGEKAPDTNGMLGAMCIVRVKESFDARTDYFCDFKEWLT